MNTTIHTATSTFMRPGRLGRMLTLAGSLLATWPAAAQTAAPPPALSLPFGTQAFTVQAVVPPATADTLALIQPPGIAPPVQLTGEPRSLAAGLRWVWGTQLTWTTHPDGRQVAQVVVHSPSASGMRLLLGLRGAARARLRFAGDQPAQEVHELAAEQYGSIQPSWSPLTKGERMALEIELPPLAPSSTVALELLKVSHHEDPAAARAQASAAVPAEVCEKQYTTACFGSPAFQKAHWQRARSAVGRLSVVKPSGRGASCTGTLVHNRDKAGIEEPLLLTAAHCLVDDSGVPSQAVADTLGVNWFFEESTCGQRDFLSTRSQFTGARLLYASTRRDIALLRLNTPPPEGVKAAYWDMTAQPSAVKQFMHHPRGDGKRQGMVVDNGPDVSVRYSPHPFSDTQPIGPLRKMLTASLTLAFGGSSGSPVFHVQQNPDSPSGDLPLVVGVLSGADLKCNCGTRQSTLWSPLSGVADELRPFLVRP